MRNLQRCLTLTALATYLLVGGLSGLCSVWHGLEIEHHHHAQAHTEELGHLHGSVCPESDGIDESHCDIPVLPCHENSEQECDELTAVTPDTPKPIATPLVGLVPAPVFAPLQIVTTQMVALSAASAEDLRGSPSAQMAQLCRFLV